MVTKDEKYLKIHILHFNKEKQLLEIVSSYKLENHLHLKEVKYASYDAQSQSVLLAFVENYVLILNLSSASKWADSICKCEVHMEFRDYRMTDMECKTALCMKRILQNGKTYLVALYD